MAATLEKTKTPGIYKRGACYVIVLRHRGKRPKQFFRTLTEAREGQRQSSRKRPVSKVGSRTTSRDGSSPALAGQARGFSETSRELYRRAISDHALSVWRGWRLAGVEPADERDLFAQVRERGGSGAQLKTLRAALSALFSTAAEDGDLSSNPIRGVRIPNGDAPEEPEVERAKGLTRKELKMLLRALPADWWLFFEFLAVTGLRISEAVGLRWEHVDLGETEGASARTALPRKAQAAEVTRREAGRALSADMAAKLLVHRRDNYGGAASPVCATTTGTPLDPHNVRRTELRPAALELGFYEEVEGRDGEPHKRSTLGFHALRHTCASMLFERGPNVRQVQERNYVHLMAEGVGFGLDLDDSEGKGWATQALPNAANPVEVGSPKTA